MGRSLTRLRVLIGGLFFRDFTGSELYIYELARALASQQCDVTIVAMKAGGRLGPLAAAQGLTVRTFAEPPEGPFDVMHGQHVPAVTRLLRLYPGVPMLCTIHSEILDLEAPVRHPQIRRYVAIRPGIAAQLTGSGGIPSGAVVEIPNPFDTARFNTVGTSTEPAVLFVGTLDPLRKAAVLDLVDDTRARGLQLWLVGKDHGDYLESVLRHGHVHHHKPRFDVETFTKHCAETAGILLGRTTIEGWLCGKPGWIYRVDATGAIRGRTRHEPPADLGAFAAASVAARIRSEYDRLLLP